MSEVRLGAHGVQTQDGGMLQMRSRPDDADQDELQQICDVVGKREKAVRFRMALYPQ